MVSYLFVDMAHTLTCQKWDLIVYVDCTPADFHANNPEEPVLHVACHPVNPETWSPPNLATLDMNQGGRLRDKCEQVVLELPMTEQELDAARGLSPQNIVRYHAWPHLTIGYKMADSNPIPSTKMKLVDQIMDTLRGTGDAIVRVLLVTHFTPLAEHMLTKMRRQGCHTLFAPRDLTRSHFLWDMVHDFSSKLRIFVVASDANIGLHLFAAAATHVFILDGSVTTPVLGQLHHSAHAMMAYLRVSIPDQWLNRAVEKQELCDMFLIRPEAASQWRARLTTMSTGHTEDVMLACVSLSQLEGCSGLLLFKGFVPQLAQPVLLNMCTLRDLKSLLGHLWYVPGNIQTMPERLTQFVNMVNTLLKESNIDACRASALLTFCLAKSIMDTLGCTMLGISKLHGTYIMHCRDTLQEVLFVVDALQVGRDHVVGRHECLELLNQKYANYTIYCGVQWPDTEVTQWHEALPELLVCVS